MRFLGCDRFSQTGTGDHKDRVGRCAKFGVCALLDEFAANRQLLPNLQITNEEIIACSIQLWILQLNLDITADILLSQILYCYNFNRNKVIFICFKNFKTRRKRT